MTTKTMRPLLAGVLLLTLVLPALPGCGGGGGGDEEKVRLVLYTPPTDGGHALDPFYDDVKGAMSFIKLDVLGDGIVAGKLSRLYYFDRAGGVASVPEVPFETRLQLVVRGYPASSANASVPSQYPLAVGRTGTFSVRSGDDVREIPLLLSRVNSFAPATQPTGQPGAVGSTVSLPQARYGLSATLLQDGRVLIVGGAALQVGASNPFEDDAIAAVSNEAYLYDPATGTMTQAGTLGLPRAFHTATLLPSGQVLIAGGISLATFDPIPQVEIYDPFAGRFTPGPALQASRARHQATLVQPSANQYLVLFTGGEGSPGTFEMYDPTATGSAVVSSGNLHTARWNHADVFVTKGLKGLHDAVYVAGGENGDGVVNTIEFFDAAVLQHVPASVVQTLPRGGRTMLTGTFNKKRGFVFFAGGFSDRSKKNAVKDVELYALDANSEPVGLVHVPATTHGLDLQMARGGHGAVQLPNSDVLFVGGFSANTDGTWQAVREGEVLTELISIKQGADGQSTMSITPIRASTDNGLGQGTAMAATCLLDSGNVLILGGVTEAAGILDTTAQASVYTYDDTPKVQ